LVLRYFLRLRSFNSEVSGNFYSLIVECRVPYQLLRQVNCLII